MTGLRDHQVDLVAALRARMAAGSRAVLVVSPTGSGKTYTFCWTAARAAERGRRVLIVVHRVELVAQTIETLQALGVDPGVIGPGDHERLERPVQVAMVQTLARRIARGGRYPHDYLVIDEAHHAIPGTTWGSVIDHAPGAYLAGYTATPERLDGRGLGVQAGGYFAAMVLGPSTRALIDQGLLAKPVVYGPPGAADFSDLAVVRGDYRQTDMDAAVEQRIITGDVVRHYRQHLDGQPTILFAASVKAAHRYAEVFKASGYTAAALDGTTDPRERRGLIRDLGHGGLQVLTSCSVVSEGTDIPAVAGAILLRPTASLSVALQQMGRALRPKPGDNRCVILDHVGVVRTHGLPQQDREWTLEGRPRRKRAADESGPVKQCQSCWAWLPAQVRACPHCGTVGVAKQRKDLHVVDADLVQINEDQVRADRRREQARAATLEDLIELGRTRGYKNPGYWARKVIQGRQSR